MTRFLMLPLLLLSLAVVAWADATSDPLLNEQARHLRRNRRLIEALVQSGLRLSREEDPLERAKGCADVAEKLAGEIRQSAAERQGARSSELALHFRVILERGVAENLAVASVPPGSSRADELKKLEVRVVEDMAKPLRDQLNKPVDADLEGDVLRAVRSMDAGRNRVKEVMLDRSIRPRGK